MMDELDKLLRQLGAGLTKTTNELEELKEQSSSLHDDLIRTEGGILALQILRERVSEQVYARTVEESTLQPPDLSDQELQFVGATEVLEQSES
jgi:hypothetical protein